MKEIEVLVMVLEPKASAIEKLESSRLNLSNKGIKSVKDLYFSKEKNQKKPITDWLRIRITEKEAFITFKKDNFKEDGSWHYSDEYETSISDPEILERILKELGYANFVTVKNKKHIYEKDNYEIVLEEVENLGLFLEIEKKNPGEDVDYEREEIFKLMKELKLEVSEEVNMGKPEMMLK